MRESLKYLQLSSDVCSLTADMAGSQLTLLKQLSKMSSLRTMIPSSWEKPEITWSIDISGGLVYKKKGESPDQRILIF